MSYLWLLRVVLLPFAPSHQKLSLTKVKTYGLYYKWQGADPSLKPILLVAHQGKLIL